MEKKKKKKLTYTGVGVGVIVLLEVPHGEVNVVEPHVQPLPVLDITVLALVKFICIILLFPAIYFSFSVPVNLYSLSRYNQPLKKKNGDSTSK